ncbi:SH3 domain-containing protein [Vibrio sp. WXL210]|uniref:SH3 domain-containing protein n=1 Tax=Vibrio sp. WXL210 TaxID=3450709 RepID=UPI003EC5064F
MKYTVVKNYSDAPESPIQVTAGEELQFVEESDSSGDWPNWVFCRGEDKEGWVPKQILELNHSVAHVLKDYSAKEHCLVKGDVLIKEYEVNGWIWCHKVEGNKESAWAPLNHLTVV